MKWNEVDLFVPKEATDPVALLLYECGSNGSVIHDDEADEDNRIRITAYFSEEQQDIRERLQLKLQELQQAGLLAGSFRIQASVADDASWMYAWQEYFHPKKISPLFWAEPAWEQKKKKKGEMAAEGTQLFTLESSRDLKVTVMISKYDIGLIKEGQKADIDMAGNIYKGTVSRIERVAVTDEADKNKVAVDIHFDSPDGRAIIGLEADVTIYTDERKNVLLIPYSAYYTDDNGDFCYVIDNGKVNKKYIKAGIVTDDLVEVKEGITEGETVITDAVTDSAVGNTARASQEKKVSAE